MNEITIKYFSKDYKIKYRPNEKLQDIFNKFGEKIKCPIYYITFFYNGNELNNNITIKDIPNFENSEKIIKAVEICYNCKSKIDVYLKNDNNYIYSCNCHKINECIFCHKNIDIDNPVICDFCKNNICSLCKNKHYQTHNNEILLKYIIKNYCGKLRLFSQKFIENNKNNCILIYKGKDYKLKSTLNMKRLAKSLEDQNYLEIRLKGNNINISRMFDNCKELISISLSISNQFQFDTINNTDISYLFNNCINLLHIPDISNWNTKNVISMEQMFTNCKSLLNLPDISKWNTSNVINMNYMFENCLQIIDFPDISRWNTSKVKYMSGLFYGCRNCKNLPDISKWDICHLIKLNSLFYGCESLKELPDISKWKTDNITDMSYIFAGCKSLLILPDISKWKTNNITNINYMFYQCKSLSYIPDISKWLTNNLKTMELAFYGCQSLVLLPNISKWNLNLVGKKYNLVANCISLSYFPDYYKYFWQSGIMKECISLMNT